LGIGPGLAAARAKFEPSQQQHYRKARYSQPKRELFGLFRALEASKYWLLSCRNLIIETDVKYIKGMLLNPSIGPNAAIMRWIAYILMYHFILRHIPGKTFAADGLSC